MPSTNQNTESGTKKRTSKVQRFLHIFDDSTKSEKRKSSMTVHYAGNETNQEVSDEEKFCKEFLEWHNNYRKLHGVPSLKSNKKLTEFAISRVKYLAQNNIFKIDLIEYGESVHIISGAVALTFTAEQIAKLWYSQKANYDFDTATPGPNSEAFTQMIWRSSRSFGTAIAKGDNAIWIVAIYDPPGNFIEKQRYNVPTAIADERDIVKLSNLNIVFEFQCLEAHNKYRLLHGCPGLKLNRELCGAASERTRFLSKFKKLEQSDNCPYGVNMFAAESTTPITGEQVVKIWYDEVTKHDFDAAKYSNKTGHFSQLIWKTTTDLGVGYLRDGNKTYVVCYYMPPGNYPGEFIDNVPKIGSAPTTAEAVLAADEEEQLEKSILIAHNKYRKMHGSPPLVRSEKLSNFATEWAESLAKRNAIEHRPKIEYGENIFLAQGVPKVTGERVVRAWYDEVKQYDFQAANFSAATGHFTQLLWATTKEIGIGVAKKNNNTWVVCNYDPPGNFKGYFKENVFKVGSPLYVDPNANIPFKQQCLLAHNKYRKIHGCPPLVLTHRLNNFATEWAKTLVKKNQLERRPSNIFGENILMSTGHWSVITGEDVVKAWYDEISVYDFNDPKYSKETCHFTQVIWKSTTEMGVDIITSDGTTIVVAYYNPAGNLVGEFKQNVPPKMAM